MDFQDCIKFANEQHDCYLATVEGDQPRVRPMGICFADKTGIYFETKSVKAVCKQLVKNPKAELVFHSTKEKPMGKVMRVTGKVEFVEDMEPRKKVYETRKHMLQAQGIKGPEDPLMVAFRIHTGEAFFWTGTENIYEEGREIIKF
jgi:pyridoxamine 5'-phosphate oxidase